MPSKQNFNSVFFFVLQPAQDDLEKVDISQGQILVHTGSRLEFIQIMSELEL